tara:strand:- start:11 stop:466 length:456 start_codon:yes stop_codon:yes gene_type:complete
MLKLTKTIEWDMGHRIPNHQGKCKFPHGHRYRLEVTILGKISTLKGASFEGMIVDFSDFKKIIRQKIHTPLDHRFMIYEQDKLLKDLFSDGLKKELNLLFVPFIPTSENIVSWCYSQLKDAFGPKVQVSSCRLFESPSSFVEYVPDNITQI